MPEEVLEKVKSLLYANHSPDEIVNKLSREGFLESDVENAIQQVATVLVKEKVDANKRKLGSFALKEFLDKVGYGFVSHPFINILFSFTGASYFLIGLINGLRAVISMFLSSFFKEFSKVRELDKKFISHAGILYGFSFLFMSFAVVLKSPMFYALAFLIGSFGIVAHGELYTGFFRKHVRKERMGSALTFLLNYGILITIVSLLISGFIMDLFPVLGKHLSFSLLGMAFELNVYGYLISFEITALAFILSGMVISYIDHKKDETKGQSISTFTTDFFRNLQVHMNFFMKKKVVLLLALTSLVTGMVQILGNSFYGIFIYDNFKDQFFGGFFNVALVFAIASVFSFIGPFFTRNLQRHIGISPMLVFGTLLTAMLPLSLAYNPNLWVVGVAAPLSILGTSILGLAQGFFIQKLLSEGQRDVFFSFMGAIVSIPMLILIPFGAWLTQIYGLVFLFKLIIFLLVLFVAPLYFLIVFLYEKQLEQTF